MRRFLRPNWLLVPWTGFFSLLLAWCFLAPAQTNAPAGATNQATGLRLDLAQSEFIKKNASALTFGLDQVEALQAELLGHPYWQYLSSLLYVLLAFLVSKLVDWLINVQLRKWASRTVTEWDDIVVGLFDGPIKVIVFVLLLNIGLQMFDWPAWAEKWFSKLTIFAVGVSLIVVVLKAIDALGGVWKRRLPADGDRSFNESFVSLTVKVLKAALVIVALFTVLGNLGFDIRTALASVSIVGLALGLAAQDTVGNLFGAVAVFVDKPFKIGDRVRIGDVDGTVEDMGVRSTRIRSLEGFVVTVPNKNIGNATVINITQRPTIRANFAVGITYDTPADRVRRAVQILEEIFKGHAKTADVVIHFNKFADFYLNIDILYWCRTTDWKEFCATLQELNLTIKERFDAEGIGFAFPTQTLYLREERNWSGSEPATTR